MKNRTKTSLFYPILLVGSIAGIFYKTVFALPPTDIPAEAVKAPAPSPVTAPAPIAVKTADVDLIETVGFFELVNSDYAVSDGFYETVSTYGVIPSATSSMYLNPTALAALEKMFGDAKAEGYGGFYLTSGFRDYAQQAELYGEAEDKSFVQPPGYSEHQTGLAADISILGVGMEKIEKKKDWRWLVENAHKYGFILRYPADKTDVTGISYEPWHFRYVGAPHAEYIYEYGLCYEEYIDFLRESGGYCYKGYTVVYATPRDGRIEIPLSGDYEIGADNTGGYIVTINNE